MRVNENEYVVYNPKVNRFEHIVTVEKKFKTIEYSPGTLLGQDDEGNEVYKAFGYTIYWNPVDMKIVKVTKRLGISVTFSVETGEGHEPLAVEITVYTEVEPDNEDEAVDKIHEAIHKILYILYDIQKDITKGSPLVGIRNSFRYKVYKMLANRDVDMGTITKFLDTLRDLAYLRGKIQYVSEKIEKEGIEYISFTAPEYPEVEAEIEQTKPRPFTYKFDMNVEKKEEEEGE